MGKCVECGAKATYGLGKTITHCKAHKTDRMKTTDGAMCKEPSCDKQASFNFPHESKFKFCAMHKETGMVNIKAKYCNSGSPRCKLTPCYASGKEVACYYHKKADMVCIKPDLAQRQFDRLYHYKKKADSYEIKNYTRKQLRKMIKAPHF